MPAKLKIAVSLDYTPLTGYFLKPDLVARLHSHDIEILPLLYDENRIQKTLDDAQGVLIPGGVGDVDPVLFGQKVQNQKVKVTRNRCDFEYKLLEETFKRKLPLLSICWGMQLLNVYLGGTLVQDIELDRPGSLSHDQTEAIHLPTHWVHLEKEAQLAKDLKTEKLFVNSTHHQAVDTLAKDLVLEGKAEDGHIEAARVKGQSFALAVQWHPERLTGDPIIPYFLAACRR